MSWTLRTKLTMTFSAQTGVSITGLHCLSGLSYFCGCQHLSFSKKKGIDLNTISGGWKTNLKVREDKDWEENEGRSVSFKKSK